MDHSDIIKRRPWPPGGINLNEPAGPVVIIATDYELSRPAHIQAMARATAALGLPRRQIPNHLAHVIYDFEGRFIDRHGNDWPMDDIDIDAAFGDDGSFRWLSGFLRHAEHPPRQSPQARVLPRLRLIDLMHRIERPLEAMNFGL